MRQIFSSFFGSLLALVLSAVAAFFGIMNILFSDIFGLDQRIESYFYVSFLYGLFALILVMLWPKKLKVWMWWLCAPGSAVGLFMSVLEPQQMIVTLGAVSFAVLGAWAGATLATKIRRKSVQEKSA